MSELKVGFGRREITPPLGVPNSLGVTCFVGEIWDRLYVTAGVLKDGSNEAVIIGADVCAFLEQPHRHICEAVGQALHIPADHVILNASHTHSASYISTELQEILGLHDIRTVDLDYVSYVKQQAVEAALDALHRVRPARLQFGRGHVERVASNRRAKLPEGKIIHRYGQPPEELRKLPQGLIDPEVLVVRVDDLDGRPVGTLVNYACHPTAADGSLHPWVSADFVGYGRQKIEAALAGAPCLFLQGCAGNIGTGKWVTGAPRDDAEAMGARFAGGALKALESAKPVRVNGLCMTRRAVPVVFQSFPPLDELNRRLQEAVNANDIMMIAHGDALVVARRLREFQQPTVNAIALGDCAIACLPAEMFVEFGLDIKKRSPFNHTLVCAYNDNSLQYIPTAAAFPEGEYEVDGGWRYIAPGEGEKLRDAALQLLIELKAQEQV